MKIRLLPCLLAILFAACITPKSKVIFSPDPTQDDPHDQANMIEPWQILESQNGPGTDGLPGWVNSYLDRGIKGIEAIGEYNDKYVFVGGNRGENINILKQWANGFTVAQDLPRLIAQRVERRLVLGAALYPDDEYGEYFEKFIKRISDEEFTGAVKEQTFWIKQKVKQAVSGEEFDDGTPREDVFFERYEYMVLVNIDKEMLQKQIREIMMGIKTKIPPTRDQAAAINKIQQNFFEGF